MHEKIVKGYMMKNSIRNLTLMIVVFLILLLNCATQQMNTFQGPDTDGPPPWTDNVFKNDDDHFQFAIVSDRTGGHRPGIFEKAIQQINLLQPEFVMCVGDLIEGNTYDLDQLNMEYNEMDSLLNSLEMRFFRVVGNHDIGNEVMLNQYRERYSLPYYHFIYKNVLFLAVSTEDSIPTHISEAQVAYMKKALDENRNVRWTLVFMHKPMFVEQQGEIHKNWAKIENMLTDRPHTVFAGHTHAYAKYNKHGESYINIATTGGVSNLSGLETGRFDHIMWVTMTDQGPKMAILLLDGIVDENVRVIE
jgi:predicted phosphodiesterase